MKILERHCEGQSYLWRVWDCSIGPRDIHREWSFDFKCSIWNLTLQSSCCCSFRFWLLSTYWRRTWPSTLWVTMIGSTSRKSPDNKTHICQNHRMNSLDWMFSHLLTSSNQGKNGDKSVIGRLTAGYTTLSASINRWSRCLQVLSTYFWRTGSFPRYWEACLPCWPTGSVWEFRKHISENKISCRTFQSTGCWTMSLPCAARFISDQDEI